MVYKGIYDRTIYYNPLSRHSIISIKTNDPNIPSEARSSYKYKDHLMRFTATGFNLPQSNTVILSLEGEWTKDEKYGYQLQVERCRESIPPTIDGVRAYLASGLLKGIGEKTADAIVAQFGIRALTVLEETPERFLEVKGITEERLMEIRNSYMESRVLRELIALLSPFQANITTAIKIHQHLGEKSVFIIKHNPFELCRFPGFAFKKVDSIAKDIGFPPDYPSRISGATFCMLDKKCRENGHLYLPKEELCKEVLKLLNVGIQLKQRVKLESVEVNLQKMILSGDVVLFKNYIYPKRFFLMEDDAARRIARILVKDTQPVNVAPILTKIKFPISEKQQKAVETAFQHTLSIITGPPGSGKTTVLKAVIEIFQFLYPEGKILLTSPTGRASRRMSEATGYEGAKTLHNALGLLGGADEDAHGDVLEADLIIVDESSMADMRLSARLFAQLKPGARLILVGDPDQLPSVGPGDVFRELIDCALIPVTVLNEIFRQSKDSNIAQNGQLINEGNTDLFYGNDFLFIDCENQSQAAETIQKLYMEEVSRAGIENVQILSPFRQNGEASADRLNRAIREEVNPCVPEVPELRVGSKTFRINDRVMYTQNTKDISNGDVGFIISFNPATETDPATVTVDFNGRRINCSLSAMEGFKLAYAMTVHKSMGSEYDSVIIPILVDHMRMLYRNLVHTAVSRAKKQIYLVGEQDILNIAIRRNKVGERNTALGIRVAQYVKSFTLQASFTQSVNSEQLKMTG